LVDIPMSLCRTRSYGANRATPGNRLSKMIRSTARYITLAARQTIMEMARREDLLIYEPHPRSKASAGYPDAIKDTTYFRDENYGGFGFRWGMGLDGSEQRLCEYRCLPLLDETLVQQPRKILTTCEY
jgi:hypothetical protein